VEDAEGPPALYSASVLGALDEQLFYCCPPPCIKPADRKSHPWAARRIAAHIAAVCVVILSKCHCPFQMPSPDGRTMQRSHASAPLCIHTHGSNRSRADCAIFDFDQECSAGAVPLLEGKVIRADVLERLRSEFASLPCSGAANTDDSGHANAQWFQPLKL
jgi:hypothetical protein